MHDMKANVAGVTDDLRSAMLEGVWFSELATAHSGCKPMDRKQLQLALNDIYEAIDQPAPKLLVFDSPAACVQAMQTNIASPLGEVGDAGQGGIQFGQSLARRMHYQFWLPLLKQLTRQLGERAWVGSRCEYGVCDLFEIDFWRPNRLLIDGLRKQLDNKFDEQFGDHSLADARFVLGASDLCWISAGSLADWAGGLLAPETSYNLGIIDRIRRQCDWWCPFENVVVASERPVVVEWDWAHRLHCEEGPAVEFSDGFKLFAWHGCNVPPHWITERTTLQPEDVLQQDSIEMRSAGASLIGWERMSRTLGSRVIDDSGSDSIGQLVELQFPEPARFLKAVCPDEGNIFEVVPRVSDRDRQPINTAYAAQAWRVNCTPAEYRP